LNTGAVNWRSEKRFVSTASSGNHIVQSRMPAAASIAPRVNFALAPARVNFSCDGPTW
jgi:hypothetical protein